MYAQYVRAGTGWRRAGGGQHEEEVGERQLGVDQHADPKL